MSAKDVNARTTILRLARISQKFVAGEEFNCSDLAQEFEVSTKTAQRDLDFMRDSLGFDFEYDQVSHAYRMTEPPPEAAGFFALVRSRNTIERSNRIRRRERGRW